MDSEPLDAPTAGLDVETLPKVRPPTGVFLPPEQRRVFLREAPSFPAWLLIFLYGGAGAALSRIDGWAWIAASSAIALIRVLIAMRALSPRQGARSDSVLATLFISTHLAQAAMWVLLLGAPDSAAHSSIRTVTSLAAAMLLSAACLRGWRAGLLAAMAGWAGAAIGTAAGLWDTLPAASIGLLVWLPATAWAGLAPSTSPRTLAAPLTKVPMVPMSGGSTRRGVQLAIHASSAPMIGVYDGRIFEMNKSAEALLGRSSDQCLGQPAAELLRLDPPSALDAAYPSPERHALVTPESGSPESAAVPVKALIRLGRSGGQAAIAVVSLAARQEYPADRELGTDARRLAEWLGADSTEVWYRDESGHLYLPKRFDPGRALEQDADSDAFPLALLVPQDERPYVNALYLEQLSAGHTFDQRLTLIDADGVKRSARVVCLSRPGFGGQSDAAIGVVSDSGGGRPQVWRADLLSDLPALIWLIDASGRVVHANSSDVQRWGLRIEPRLRPHWASALALRPGSHEAFESAVQKALNGKPTFDLLNYRTGRSGGKMPLRSHFVPFQSPSGDADGRQAVMVMDTIASVHELLEAERVRLGKAQYKDLVEASPNLIWACDSMFRFTFVSRRACRDVYDHTVEELLGHPMSALFDAQADQTGSRQALVGLRNGRALRDVEMAHVTKDGRQITVAMSAVALRAPEGHFAGAIGINVDVTALKQREARLAEALRVERSVLDSAGQAIAVVKVGTVARCNDAFLQLLRMRPDELATVPVADLFAERNQWNEVAGSAERASATDDAVAREIRVRRATLEGEIRRREAHAQHDARHDELTGLPNRRLLSERVRAALATSALRNSGCAILVFDLDGFKPINDQYGHPAGDLVLREIAQRLQNIVRPQDTVARIGGDEFALLMPDCGSVQDVERIAQRILRELAQPLTAADLGGARLTASLGVVMAPEHGREPEWLMRLADRAMYDAKVEGGDRVVFSGNTEGHVAFTDQAARRAS
jgi:diguanylate cyclase (GGDEF)-like protein/PAS domain S-box-containing protein